MLDNKTKTLFLKQKYLILKVPLLPALYIEKKYKNYKTANN